MWEIKKKTEMQSWKSNFYILIKNCNFLAWIGDGQAWVGEDEGGEKDWKKKEEKKIKINFILF